MNLHVVSPLRNFWVRVFVGNGQLGGVSVQPPAETGSSQPLGDYLFQFGQAGALVGKDLVITADVQKTSLSSNASITAELWETIPDRYLTPGMQVCATTKFNEASFRISGSFAANGLAKLTLTITIR